MPSLQRGTVTRPLERCRTATGFAPAGLQGSGVVLNTLRPLQSRRFPPHFKTKAWEVRRCLSGVPADKGIARALCECLRGISPEQPAAQGPGLGRDGSAAQVSALATQGLLPPACCSAAPWPGLHHAVLQTVNSCIIARFVHTGAVVTFETGLGHQCSQQQGRSGAGTLWGVSCCNPGH